MNHINIHEVNQKLADFHRAADYSRKSHEAGVALKPGLRTKAAGLLRRTADLIDIKRTEPTGSHGLNAGTGA